MSKSELLELACRIFGLWVLLQALQYAAPAVQSAADFLLGNYRRWGYATVMVLMVLFTAALGLVLLIWARGIARFLTGREADDQLSTGMDKEQVQEVAFNVLGIWLIAMTVVALPLAIPDLWRTVPQVLRLALGIFLVFRARGIVRCIGWLRKAGKAGSARAK